MTVAEPLNKPSQSAAAQWQLPLVQVGIPVYNGGAEIRATVEGLLEQDYENLEIMISDNASTDETGEICAELVQKYPRVKYFRNPENMGSFYNFSSLYSKSTGKYYFWCGHNDSFSSGFISKAVEIMERDPEVVLCFPRGELITESGEEYIFPSSFIDTRNFSRETGFLAAMWHVWQCTEFYGLYRRSVLASVMPARRCLVQDCLQLIEIAAQGSFAYIPSERIKLKMRQTNLIKTAVRHGFKVHRHLGLEQYVLFCWHLTQIAFKYFSLPSLLMMLPSLTLCLAEKFIWIFTGTNYYYEEEIGKNACK